MEEMIYFAVRLGCAAYLLYKVWEQKGKWLIEGGIIGMEKTMPKLQATTQRAGEMAFHRHRRMRQT